jgi:hypothetical protein
MERMLQLLVSLGEVKNYTLYGRVEPHCPPIILVWYWRVRDVAVTELTRALASYRGSLAWCLQAIPSGWALTPKRLPELTADRRPGGFLGAARVLMEEEPDFGEVARRDLESLADHVTRNLKPDVPSRRSVD